MRTSLLVGLLFCSQSLAQAGGPSTTLEGRVVWDPAVTAPAAVKLVLTTAGRQQFAWPEGDSGRFAFHGVTPGSSHLLEVSALHQVYAQYRVDVSSAGKQRVVLADAPQQVLPKPLVIHPRRRGEYFEQRRSFDLLGFMRTPYGLMIGFGVFAIFVLPKLRLDPEELQELAAESQGGARRTEQALPAGSRRKDQ